MLDTIILEVALHDPKGDGITFVTRPYHTDWVTGKDGRADSELKSKSPGNEAGRKYTLKSMSCFVDQDIVEMKAYME